MASIGFCKSDPISWYFYSVEEHKQDSLPKEEKGLNYIIHEFTQRDVLKFQMDWTTF